MGNSFFGKRIVNSLSKKISIIFLYSSLKDINFMRKNKNIKIIHYIGSPTVSFHGILSLIRLRIFGKKIIIHWIGADSWMATNEFFPKIFTKLFKNQIALHISIEKKLANRIKAIGINTIIHPLPVATHFKMESLPIKKQILVYAPDMTDYYWNRFNGEIIKKIVNVKIFILLSLEILENILTNQM